MLTILVAVGLYLAALAVVLVAFDAMVKRASRRHRLEVARRVVEAARPLPETLLARRPAGPAQDALRSAQLRLLLDKTEPRA